MKPATAGSGSDRSDARIARLFGDLAAGTLSTLVMLCYAMSLGTMIFSADLARYAELGVPTALVSCVVTALVIALTSSMRMNIGGPDSNATAFLVGVAAGVASSVRANGGSPTAILLTVLISIALCSIVTGIILFSIGSSKRSRSLQFLPYPVMGGFLAGTGYLLLTGAFRVLTGHAPSWQAVPLLIHLHWLAWVPALVVGALATILHRVWKHAAVLPATLGFGILLFYVLLHVAGIRIDDARDMGLLLQHVPMHALQLPELHLPRSLAQGEVDWHAIGAHLPETLVVTSVSAITILMNSTAIGAATGQDVDLNREMRAAGLANIASGMLGGMVGYQSYNRSMLNARAGATSRVAGVFAALACLLVLAVSPDLVALFPVPVLVGLQIFMGLRLLMDWLVGAWGKLDWNEYLLVPLILGVIAVYGVVAGVVAGVLAACVTFALLYGRVSCVRMEFDGSTRTSNVERTIEQAERLKEHGSQVCGTCLQGFLFFGTANSILHRVRERLGRNAPMPVRYVVLDFGATNGVDASVSVSFMKLKQVCEARGVLLVLTGLPARSRQLLARTGTLSLGIHEFDTLDAGLEWIEERQLDTDAGKHHTDEADFHATLAHHFTPLALERLMACLEMREIGAGELLFRHGEPGDAIFLVERGHVRVSLTLADGRAVRLRSFGPGTIVGEMAVYSQRPRSADVIADEPARLWRLSLAALQQLERDEPLTAQQWHRFVVKVMASRLAIADDALRVAL
ncbi:sulfate transporter membrane protein [Caballeronia arationis]|uniref:Sulfate permease, SulP family n=1 Tax=Caballeronia arationis TaxID=1777142 RepID=A0A7Z7I4B9_9BURK|nr:SulP family inorganic anion transporter [Caballeronia arationis]SAK54531.1 sulfate transporter membrane protein [Caballeronia arationis]SOE61518.1 sulfate permease, SulP family [Caballeronia arationis]